MDDLVQMQVIHATSNAHGPVNQQGGGDRAASPEHLIQLPLGAELHQDAVTGSLCADTPEARWALVRVCPVYLGPIFPPTPRGVPFEEEGEGKGVLGVMVPVPLPCSSLESDDVRVLQLPQMLDVRLLEVSNLLHGHFLPMEASQENSALSP